ncbi:MAG: protein kinase [Clostridiaceae bacterium]|nr:protein kinase [Clostridiaceae bacterium]
MTARDEYIVSIYEELTVLGGHENIKLVKNTVNDTLCVKKTLINYNKDVYITLKEKKIPGIPKIYEIIETPEQLIVIEEYIHGQTLAQKDLKKKDIAAVKSVVKELCDILEQLHNLNPPVIHRDIKPENIIITNGQSGSLYLTDFDISRVYVPNQDRDTVIMGTSGYASPEQCGFAQTDARSDIYSIGMLMKNLLQIDHPQNKEEARMKNIIDKCISIDPDKRYKTIGELRRRLDMSPEFSKKNRSLLPPGFRSGVWYKMLIAICGYLFIFYLSMEMNVEINDPVQQAQENAAIKIVMLLSQLLTVAIYFNWQGFRDKLPIVNSPHMWLRIIGYVIYPIIIAFLLILAGVIITLII